MSRITDSDKPFHLFDPYAELIKTKVELGKLKTERDQMFEAFENMVNRIKKLEETLEHHKLR
jgi:hypothetical protein|tara:strand:+ start:4292 stop:4477 length:186 start_codon:yes stop_codon:yes gene_type:complete